MTEFFFDENKTSIKSLHFGVEGYLDYTVAPHDKQKGKRNIEPRKRNENWIDGMTVGARSRYILWAYHALNNAIRLSHV